MSTPLALARVAALARSGVDFSQLSVLEQHPFVVYEQRENRLRYVETVTTVAASLRDPVKLKDLLSTLESEYFPGIVESKEQDAVAADAKLRAAVNKTYQITLMGNQGVLEIGD